MKNRKIENNLYGKILHLIRINDFTVFVFACTEEFNVHPTKFSGTIVCLLKSIHIHITIGPGY